MTHHCHTSTTAQTPKQKDQNNNNYWPILQSLNKPCQTPEQTTSASQMLNGRIKKKNANVKLQVTSMNLSGSSEHMQTKQTHTLKTDQLSPQCMIWLTDIQAQSKLLDTETYKIQNFC